MLLFMRRLAVAIALTALPLCASQDDAVSLVIRFANGSNQFKVGQVIPVELAFSTSKPNQYRFNTASYDRSGRLEMEQFEVAPKGRDPLYSYLYDSIDGFIEGGGLYTIIPLDKEPQILQRNLNEWVALDKPGHYTLRVTSPRVGRLANKSKQPNYLISNVLEFDVAEADAPWQQQMLSEAIASLDNPATSQKNRDAAEQTLRFLDCPESVRELARQLTKPGDGDKWNFAAGLLGARNQDLVLKELEARFTMPDAALTQNYMSLLGRMQFAATHAPLPPYPQNDVAKQKIWQAQQEKMLAELNQADDALYLRAVDSLALKQGAAKASTIATILVRPRGPRQEIRLPDAEIASAFPLLDEQQQETILETFSSRILSPSMTGPLEAILDKPNLSGVLLRTSALQALLAVNPERGRARILAEIREPHAEGLNNVGFLARCLNRLPDETLPELNDFLVNRLEKSHSPTRDLDAQLIGRYATRAIFDRVTAIYVNEADSWDCAAADGLMRYFLRWDQGYGLSIFMVKGSSCTTESLNEVVRLKRWPEVEPAFIQRLNDPDLWRAKNAAELLGQLGGAPAKRALLRRLRAFNKTWALRAGEFRSGLNAPQNVREAMTFQSSLIESLAQAKGWTLSKEEDAEVKSLTVMAER
jgi:hypothetical protein